MKREIPYTLTHILTYILLRIMIGTFLLTVGLAGCSGDSAKDIYDTAHLEELQKNREHAVQLYEEILKKYPESEYAKKAEERLTEIRGNR